MMHNTDIATDSAETAALVVDGPQPVWMTLNQARERAFTGEIVFEADPEVLAYLDDGIVYYAERAADAPLGQRLLDAGVVDATQLERGTVRIGDLEHLGRLFDRDPSVDRDAVDRDRRAVHRGTDRRPGEPGDRRRAGHRLSPPSLRRAPLVRCTARPVRW